MSNVDLLSAAFTAIFGKHWQRPPRNGKLISIHELFSKTYIMGPPLELIDPRLLFDVFFKCLSGKVITISVAEWFTIAQVKVEINKQLDGFIPISEILLIKTDTSTPLTDDTSTLGDYGIKSNGAHLSMVLKLRCSICCDARGPFRLNADELDPIYDFDFSNVDDDGETYMRGGFMYQRPYGWKRLAIKVVGKYENDDWLGPDGIRTEQATGEWPVSYHGTDILRASQTVLVGFEPGSIARYGKGIYTSPSLEMVEKFYAQEFTHEGKSYKIVLQNRVNPNGLQVIPASQTGVGGDFWLSQRGDDVRAYGVLIREVKNSDEDA